MPDIPRTLAQLCFEIKSNVDMIAHIHRLSEAYDKLRERTQAHEAELAALRTLLQKGNK